jgi:hypothetical protein
VASAEKIERRRVQALKPDVDPGHPFVAPATQEGVLKVFRISLDPPFADPSEAVVSQ